MDKIWKTWYQSDQGVTMCGFTSICICICNCILPECIAGEEEGYWYQGDQGVDQLGCHHCQLRLECRGVKDLIYRHGISPMLLELIIHWKTPQCVCILICNCICNCIC